MKSMKKHVTKATKRWLALGLAVAMAVSSLSPAGTLQVQAETETLAETVYTDPNHPGVGTTQDQPFIANTTGGSQYFRIPALITAKDGELIAAADARWNHTSDFGGIDTIISTSTDKGAYWHYSFPNYFGDNGNQMNQYSTTFIDPQLTYDPSTGTVYMLVDLFAGGYATAGAWYQSTAPNLKFPLTGSPFVTVDGEECLRLRAAGTDASTEANYTYYLKEGQIYDSSNSVVSGYTVDAKFNIYKDGTYQSNLFFNPSVDTTIGGHSAPDYLVYPTTNLWLIKSTDNGASWSDPELLNLKMDGEPFCGVGPGKGLVTSGGVIMFPCYYFDGYSTTQKSSVIYSVDGGVTWNRTDHATSPSGEPWSSENQLVELEDGTVRMFFRNSQNMICYVDATITGTGENTVITWAAPVTTTRANFSNCQLSAIKYSEKIDGKEAILVSCPTVSQRYRGQIFVGLVNDDADQTMEWKYVYDGFGTGRFQYSCMAELEDGTVGILYEDGDASIVYKNIALTDIVGSDAVIGDLWATDESGEVVNSLSMRVSQSAALTVNGSLVTVDNAPSITWTATDVATITQNGAVLTITPTATGSGVLTISDGTNTITVKVEVTTTKYTEAVTLKVGETAKFTDDSGYYVGTEEVGDDSVATLNVTGKAKQNYASIGTDYNYDEGCINIEENLYTFTPNTYVVQSSVVEDVYLHHRGTGGAGYTNSNTAANITIGDRGDGTFTLHDNDYTVSGNGSYLVFMKGGYVFDRYGSATENTTSNWDTYFELYTPLAEGEESTENLIEGYRKINKGTELRANGQYLIAHKGDDDNYYVLYPSVGSTNKYDYIGKVEGENVIKKTATGFDASSEELSKCLFTFSENTNPATYNYYYISANVDETEVYFNLANANNGIPQAAAADGEVARLIQLIQPQGDEVFKLRDATTNAILHFERDTTDTSTVLTMNRCGTGKGESCGTEDEFHIYVKSESASAESAIIGYQKITAAEKLASGGQYLIAAELDDQTSYEGVYLLHPSINTDKYKHISKVSGCIQSVAQVGKELSNSKVNFADGEIKELSELLYTFKTTTVNETTGYSIYSPDENGDPRLYLSLRNGGGTEAPKVNVGSDGANSVFTLQCDETTKTFYFHDEFGGNGKTGANLHFHSDKQTDGTTANTASNYHYFNRCSSTEITIDDYNHRFVIYREALEAEICTEILGYKRVESLEEIVDGKQYLIGFDDGGTIYLLNPPENASDGGFAHVALHAFEEHTGTTDITIEGKKVGYTEAVVGDTTYQITVKSADIYLTLNVGQTTQVEGSIVQQPEGDAVTMERKATGYESLTAFGEFAEGSYLIGVNSYIMINEEENVSGNPKGLGTLTFNQSDTSQNYTPYLWEFKAVDGGFTIQDAKGKYLSITETNGQSAAVVLSTEPHTFVVSDGADGKFFISSATALYSGVGYHLNNYAGGNNNIAGYAASDSGSKLYLHQPTGFATEIIGANIGQTTMVIDDTTYHITVVDTVDYTLLDEQIALVNARNMVNDTSYTQASRDALAAVLAKAEEMTASKDTKEYSDEEELAIAQKAVDTMYNQLTEAIKELQKATESLTVIVGETRSYVAVGTDITTAPDTNIAGVAATTDGTTGEMKLTVTGNKAGITTAVVGGITYTIYVVEDPETSPIVAGTGDGTSTQEGTAGVVTRLTISADRTFDFNYKDTSATVTWSTPQIQATDADGNLVTDTDGNPVYIATITADGVLSFNKDYVTSEMTTTVTATVDGNTYTVPVIIRPAPNTTDVKELDIYIEEITNMDVYYSWMCGTDLMHARVGEAIYVNFGRTTETYAIDFMGAPYDGHALTYMARTGTTSSDTGHYMTIHTGDGVTLDTSEAGFLNYLDGAGQAQSSAYGEETVKAMLYEGIAEGADGILGFTRTATGGHGNVVSSLTFQSEKLPTIEKTVAGILPANGNSAGYRQYSDDMTATVGEYVYFKINVTTYRPLHFLEDDTSTTIDESKQSTITYTNMTITDTALSTQNTDGSWQGASLVEVEVDADGNIINVTSQTVLPDEVAVTKLINDDIMADLWETDETEKSHEYYLVYQIQQDDFNKTLENTAQLDYKYSSKYSTGVFDVAAEAGAEILISSFVPKNVVVDFALATTVHFDSWGDGADNTKLQVGRNVGKASYGQVDVAGNLTNGWDITYRPTAVLQGVDIVSVTAVDGVTEYNFRVYPANSVYYEESFMTEEEGTWNQTGYEQTAPQEAAEFGDTQNVDNPAANYGYDAAYEEQMITAVVQEASSTGNADKSQVTFNGETKELSDCLYTFVSTGNENEYYISAVNENGQVVYLNFEEGSDYGTRPHSTTASEITVLAGTKTDSTQAFRFKDVWSTNGNLSHLHFRNTASTGLYFDRCSGNSCTQHDMMIYEWTGNTAASPISGYEPITALTEIVNGGQYLIVAPGTDSTGTTQQYILNPPAGDADTDFHNASQAPSWMHVAQLSGTAAVSSEYIANNADANGAFAQNLANSEAAFTFTGTGVDLYANCTTDSGLAMVLISKQNADGTSKLAKVMMVDTKLKAGAVDGEALTNLGTTYNVPFISLPADSLEHGTYKVAIVHATSKVDQETGQMDENNQPITEKVSTPTKLKLDGFRVYGTLTAADDAMYYAADREANMVYKDMRDTLLAAWKVNNVTDGVYAEQLAKDTLSQIYAAGGQQLAETAGAMILDSQNAQIAYTGEQLKDYLDNSSKNEVYLYPGQSLVFSLTEDNVNPQLAMKALNGVVSYSVTAVESADSTTGTPVEATMNASTEMYYPLDMAGTADAPVQTTFTITNSGTTGVLAITKLKTANATGAVTYGRVTPKDVTMALISLGFASEEETPEVTTAPEITVTPEVTNTPEITATPEATITPETQKSVTEIFTDVHDDWYTAYVQYVYDNQLMTGIKGTTEFRPDANITKAQVAQVLFNMEKPSMASAAVFDELTDVYVGEWYADAVAWAYDTGVVTGDLNTNKFEPNADVTREQLALMLYRYAEYKKYDTSQTSVLEGLVNADKVANWSEDAVRWAVGAGLITGIEKDGVKDLAPQGTATRAQMAAMLQRFCENVK